MKMKYAFISLAILVIVIGANAQQTGSFKDLRDGITYKTVKIGTQTWMAENLNTSSFRNGDPVPEAKTDEEWVIKKAGWCYYNNDPKNGALYGKLYNWYALTDTRGLAPEGWHLPSEAEWNTLSTFLGGISEAGTKMKNKSGWNDNGNGTNESGFSGLPGSLRYEEGQFNDIGRMGFWWTTTPNIAKTLSHTLSSNSYLGWGMGKEGESYGFAVRCVMDQTGTTSENKNSPEINTTKTGKRIETFSGKSSTTTITVSSATSITTTAAGNSQGKSNLATPTLTTKPITNVLVTTATSGGNISGNGGAMVSATGVCWSTSPNPTITANSKTVDGPGTTFTSSITGLTTYTKYYVRAYATNSAGTGYGNELTFTTLVVDKDGNPYHFVAIGNQVWLVENLRTSHYNDGTLIPNTTGDNIWDSLTTGAFCNYNNDIANAKTYSHLYNWYAATDSRKICPAAWHVPTDTEWTTLTNNLGGESEAGGKIKSKSGWDDDGNGTNSSGFTALPGGYREDNYNSACFYIGSKGYFWSSTQFDNSRAWYRELRNAWGADPVSNEIYKDYWGKSIGFSIRCVNDR